MSKPKSPNRQAVLDQAKCIYHSGSMLTNFCKDEKCFMPLCPECVTIHIEKHKKDGDYGEINTLEATYLESFNYVAELKSTYQKLLEITKKYSQINENFMSALNDKIARSKQKLLLIIENYFKTLTKTVQESTEFQKVAFQAKLKKVESQIDQKIKEMEAATKCLETPQFVSYMIKFGTSEFFSQNENYQERMKQYLDSLEEAMIQINTDDSALYKINLELSKYMSIKNNELYSPNAQTQQKFIIPEPPEPVYSSTISHSVYASAQQGQQSQERKGLVLLFDRPNDVTESFVKPVPAKNKTPEKSGRREFIVGEASEISNQRSTPVKSPVKPFSEHTDFKRMDFQATDFVRTPLKPSGPKDSGSASFSAKRNNATVSEEQSRGLFEEFGSTSFTNTSISAKTRAVANKQFFMDTADYFEPTCPQKFLHHFLENSQDLYVLDLDCLTRTANHSAYYTNIPLDIPFKIHINHRSLITPYGDIFMTGGVKEDGNNSKMLYQLNLGKRTLDALPSMLEGRSGHGFVFCNNYLYVVGGNTDFDRPSTACESYDLVGQLWRNIAPLRRKRVGFSIVAYEKRFLFAFGGSPLSRISIERYQILGDVWTDLQINLQDDIDPRLFGVPSYCGACPISEEDIFIFGGIQDRAETSQTFIFNVSKAQGDFNINTLNRKMLPVSCFSTDQAIFHDNMVFAIMNNSVSKGLVKITKKRILTFDGKEWADLSEL